LESHHPNETSLNPSRQWLQSIAASLAPTPIGAPEPTTLNCKVHVLPTLLRVSVHVPPMKQTVTDVPSVQVVHMICHALVAHVDLEPTLCKLIHFPLKVKDLLVGKIISVQKQKHRLTTKKCR
jgi:hypothetical protein